MQISVVIPTHNPRLDYLARVLTGLRAQTLPQDQWELIIVDNASDHALAPQIDLTWHPQGRVIIETQLGLTNARLAGFAAACGEVVILVDDDNVLAPDYLAQALALAAEQTQLGTWSGNVALVFEPGIEPPPALWRSFLTERAVRTDAISREREHHDSTPWGAGLCIRRAVCAAYRDELAKNPQRRQLDLHGQTLLYGGDTDIAYVGCAHGFSKGVFNRFHVDHLIPPRRCKTDYLIRAMEGHAYSSVVHGYILSGKLDDYFASPIWQTKAWLRRLLLSRTQRIHAACHARGTARAVRDFRRMQTQA